MERSNRRMQSEQPATSSRVVDGDKVTIEFFFPGMWLSRLTKTRYEVKEKKFGKKQKLRGLKGMKDSDSDSE
ncbi:hypothetical protein VNO77_02796 [Canavalia gladiata]|uniref:Uncharacterized protein n=1 Tax=Canavalia gladiata TaxID=3824 RepID=A0AAN9RBL6_CANGL